MKIRQVVIGLIGLIALGIAFGVGRYFRPTAFQPTPPQPAPRQPTPLVGKQLSFYVSSDSLTGKCQVNPPIWSMSYNNDQVRWVDEDTNNHKYWVDFTNVNPPAGSGYPNPKIPPPDPPNPPGTDYSPESPLEHNEDHVLFSPGDGNDTGWFKVKHKTKYYFFAIFDQSNPSQACKFSTDDNDTGLNVKR